MPASMLLDDFTTGPIDRKLSEREAVEEDFQPGSMAGGFRKTSFQIRSRQGLPANLSIGPDPGQSNAGGAPSGRLIVSTGIDVTHRLEVIYGLPPGAQTGGLALDVRGFNRFEVDFDFIDTQVNLLITVLTPKGFASDAKNPVQFLGMVTGPFKTVAIPFSKMTGPGEGFEEVGAINMVLQTAQLMRGGNDYSVKALRLAGDA